MFLINVMGRMIIRHFRRVLFNAVHYTDVFVSITFITMLMTSITHLFNITGMCK